MCFKITMAAAWKCINYRPPQWEVEGNQFGNTCSGSGGNVWYKLGLGISEGGENSVNSRQCFCRGPYLDSLLCRPVVRGGQGGVEDNCQIF